MKFITVLFTVLSLSGSISCSKKNYASKPVYQFMSINGKPDYSDLSYWAAHPWKWDPSDSVPQPLRAAYLKDSLADVFFLYPTSLISLADKRWNADTDDAVLNGKTDYSSILYQASAFAEKARIFSPRYRQAHLRAYYTSDALAAKAFDLAYEDIRQAFEYYITNYNNGRPLIIASHSQGTTHAMRLMKDYFENKPLMNQLVCAYLIGMQIPSDHFTVLQPCQDSASTACYVGWRTYKREFEGTSFVMNETTNSVVTNPLLWNTSQDYAPGSFNKGSILSNFNKLQKRVVDAQVHKNILWSRKPRFFGNVFLRMKNYHIADINFFYVNIAENVKTRIGNYQKMK